MDILFLENFNGGDIEVKGNTVVTTEGFETMVYLALFGGNTQANTPTARNADEQAFDYWANSLLWPQTPEVQFNSLTERTLQNTPLSSAGRLTIEEAVKADLAFMAPFARIAVTTAITGPDRLQININIIRPDNLEEKQFIFVWDATLQNLVTDRRGTILPTYYYNDALHQDLELWL